MTVATIGLEDDLIDATQRTFPLPIADAVLLCASTASLYETKDRLLVAFRSVMRVIAVIALAAQRQRPEVPLTVEARQKLDKLRRADLADGDWIGLARGLLAPWGKTPDDHRVPELVRLFHGGRGEIRRVIDELCAIRNPLAHESPADEADLRRQVEEFVPRLTRLLQAVAPLWERLRLVVALAPAANGARQTAWRAYGPTPSIGRWRSIELARGTELGAGTVALVDADGRPVLALTPLAIFRRPSPEAVEELFLLDEGKRSEAVYLSLPGGRKHAHKDIWSELATLFADGAEGAAQAAVPTRPYRGLASFGPDDAALFFGREELSETLANRVRANGMVTVTGASGSGKTSLLHAGVGPQLTGGVRPPGTPYRDEDHARRWVVVALRPGHAPMVSLTAALERALPGDENATGEDAPWSGAPEALAQALVGYARRRRIVVVLIVDQAEELFTLGASIAEQSAFGVALAALGASVDLPTRVVLSLRQDFFAHLARIPALASQYARAVQVVTAPDDDALLRALVEPALRFKARFEEGVAEQMVADVAGSPSALALLQFTADRLWDVGSQDKVLTRSEYNDIGRVGGALSKHADKVIGTATEGRAAVAKRILLRLVTAEDTRAIEGREKLLEGLGNTAAATQVLDALVEKRLLTVREASDGTATYEISHEALLSEWQTLKEWREESREDRGQLARLTVATIEWERARRAEELLWQRGVLAAGLLWERDRGEAVGKQEGEFLRASEAAERRSRRLRTGVIAGVMTVLTVFAVVAGLQWRSARARTAEAIREREVGVYQTLLARSRELDSTHHGTEATVMLAAATQQEIARGLVGASAHADLIEHQDHMLARVFSGHTDRIYSVSFSPDGTRLVTGSGDQTARVWEVSTGRLLHTLEGHTARINSASFSPDGTRLVTGSDDRTARVWEVSTGRLLHTLEGHTDGIYSVSFSPDGTRLVTGSFDRTARLWRTEPPDPAAAIADVLHRTNLRVCRDSLKVIPVEITPTTLRDVWAPVAACRSAADPTRRSNATHAGPVAVDRDAGHRPDSNPRAVR